MIVEEKNIQIQEKFDASLKDVHLSLLRQGRDVYVRSRGMSMYPFIKDQDKIRIIPVDSIKVGDIVAVIREDIDGWFIVHRLVRIEKSYNGENVYFTKGDFSKGGLDAPLTIDSIAGKAVWIERKDIAFDLESPAWRYLNPRIAALSLNHPQVIPRLARYISLIGEWRWFFNKLRRRILKGSPLTYNTEQLLLLSIKKDFTEKEKAIEIIKEGVRWQRLLDMAINGQVAVLLYRFLSRIYRDVHVPRFVLDRLRSAYFSIISNATLQQEQLKVILRLLAAHDIRAIPLKGIFLSRRLYGDTASRGVSVDFDLLIDEKNKFKASVFLEAVGYSRDLHREIPRWSWQYTLTKPGETMVDLQWDITMMLRTQARIAWLWRSARFVSDETNVPYYEFSEEELLLYLCAHMANSNTLGQLRYICDIERLLGKYAGIISWPSVIDKAKKWRLVSSLYMAIRLEKNLLDSPTAAKVLGMIKMPFAKKILINAFCNKKVFMRRGLRKRFMYAFLRYIFFELIEARSLGEHARIFVRVFFPPKEVLAGRNYFLRIILGPWKLVKKIRAGS
ncbi:MAG: nucleotidyltransferase family protein [Candidatus Omnitrophica bacterium]|nr:nucleotidyltransferase family protein [Candidatus Omnitrophota bacterium]